MTPNDKIIGLIRTYVPYGIGAFIAWLFTSRGIDLRGEFATALIAFTVVGVQNGYYLAVRLIEARLPGVGVLLGFAATPGYVGVSSLWASFVRTAFPTLIGVGLFALANLGFRLDAETQSGLIIALVAIAQVIYYGASRAIIERVPKLSWLLIVNAKPSFI